MNKLDQLNELLEKDVELREQVIHTEDSKKVYELLTAKGMDVTEDEFNDLLYAIGEAAEKKMGEGELSEEALENVAGGSGLLFTIGGVTIKLTAAAAAAFGVGATIGIGVGLAALGVAGYYLLKKKKK